MCHRGIFHTKKQENIMEEQYVSLKKGTTEDFEVPFGMTERDLQKAVDESIEIKSLPLAVVNIVDELEEEMGIKLIRINNTVEEYFTNKETKEELSSEEFFNKEKVWIGEYQNTYVLVQYGGFVVKGKVGQVFDNKKWIKKLSDIYKPLIEKGSHSNKLFGAGILEIAMWDPINKWNVTILDKEKRTFVVSFPPTQEDPSAIQRLERMLLRGVHEAPKIYQYTEEEFNQLEKKIMVFLFVAPTFKWNDECGEMGNQIGSWIKAQNSILPDEYKGFFIHEGQLAELEFIQE